MPVILPQIHLCCRIILAMQVLTVELLKHLAMRPHQVLSYPERERDIAALHQQGTVLAGVDLYQVGGRGHGLLVNSTEGVSSNHQEPLFLKKIFLMMDAIIDSH